MLYKIYYKNQESNVKKLNKLKLNELSDTLKAKAIIECILKSKGLWDE